MISHSIKSRNIVAVAVALALALVGAMAISGVVAEQANAGLPAICDQYPNLPECEENVTPPGEQPGDEGGPTAEQGAAGELPFTGYPLTPLILLLLALLLAGLAIRTYLAVRDRLADDNSLR